MVYQNKKEANEFLRESLEKFGSSAGDEYGSSATVPTMADTVELILSDKTEQVMNMAEGELSSPLGAFIRSSRRNGVKVVDWNTRAEALILSPQEIKSTVCQRMIDLGVKEHLDSAGARVAGMLFHCGMAIELSEISKSAFFEHAVAIFRDGHILCGWSGKYPHGEPLVF